MKDLHPATFPAAWPVSTADCSRLTDEELLGVLRNGQNDALTALFDRYHRLVYSIAMRIVRDSCKAEDVMQNAFFEIFRSVAHFDPSRGTCKVWVLQYGYHRAIHRRQQLNAKSFYNLASMEDAERTVSSKQSNFGRFTNGELKHLMRQGLATLNAAQKEVIELATYQGLRVGSA